MPTLLLDGVLNKYAVYEGDSEAPLTNPLGNLPSILWHSDFPYIGAQQTVTGTVNLDPTTSGWVGTVRQQTDINGNVSNFTTYPYTYTLTTHGLAYSPYFLGFIRIGTEELPMNGSFIYGYNMYNVHSDATGIKLVADRLVNVSFNYNLSCAFSLRVLNAGTNASGAAVLPTFLSGFDATPERMRCGYFDTNNRYFIEDSAGDLRFHTGRTIDVQIFQPKYRSATCRAACVIYKSGSYIASALGSNSQSTSFATPYYGISVK